MKNRIRYRQGLSNLYLPIYDKICEYLPEEWQPYSGLRTAEEQLILFNQGRGNLGKVVTNAAPWDSPHNWGCATDWTIFINDKPTWSLTDIDWHTYKLACDWSGAEWGGDFKSFKDKPHNQLPIKCSYRYIGERYRTAGLDSALEYLEDNIIKKG